MLNISDKGKVY